MEVFVGGSVVFFVWFLCRSAGAGHATHGNDNNVMTYDNACMELLQGHNIHNLPTTFKPY